MSMSSIDKYRERVRSIENTPEFLLEMVKLAFAEELCRLLEEQGVSRTQLAERLGTSRTYITRILRTDYNLTAETMVKVALALDARVVLSLQSQKTATASAVAVPARTPRRRERRHESAAADRPTRARRNEFVASDKPARARRQG
jgi:transcriptional regulator with XRE-family HTH domain